MVGARVQRGANFGGQRRTTIVISLLGAVWIAAGATADEIPVSAESELHHARVAETRAARFGPAVDDPSLGARPHTQLQQRVAGALKSSQKATLTEIAGWVREARVRGFTRERRARIDRLERALALSKIADAALVAYLSNRGVEPGSREGQLAQVLKRRPDLRRRVARVTALWLLHFTYRGLSSGDLENYAELLESSVGRAELASTQRAMLETLRAQGSLALARGLWPGRSTPS